MYALAHILAALNFDTEINPTTKNIPQDTIEPAMHVQVMGSLYLKILVSEFLEYTDRYSL